MRIFRTTFLLVALTLLLMFVGQIFGGRNGMTLGLGIAICVNAFAYFFSDKIALASSGAQRVSREQVPRLYEVMERLAGKARLPMPKLYVVPEAAPNLEGVIAHELSHVRNYDILISSVAATLAGAIMWIPRMGYWFGFGDRDSDGNRGSGILGLLIMILAPIGAMFLQFGLSRQREYSADETGARMVGQPYGLISALEKLGAYNQRIPTTSVSPSTSALCIVKPLFGSGGLSSLFSTHPPLEKRIQALR
ncbi:MAG: protease HtpX, partial [Acidobacteria bacterium]